MRHGLLIPPMYGMPGGLHGEITLPQILSDAGYVTQAVGKWHMGENVESQPQHVGFDDFYGFLSVSDMYTEWRDPYFFPEIVYSDARTEWVENIAFNKCFVHATRGNDVEAVEEVTIPVLSLLDDKWCTYSEAFIESRATDERPWFLYHCTRGAHFDNYPHPDFLGRSPAKHPYKDALIELDDDLRPADRRARTVRPTRVDDGRDLLRQRARDGDLARLCVHTLPLRKGLHLGRRRARPGSRVVAGNDRAWPHERRARASPRSLRDVRDARGCRGTSARPIAISTPSTKRRFFSPPPTRPKSCRIASSSTTG